MNVGEINKGAVALIMVLLLGAGGYLWYSKMYQPAVLAQKTAVTAAEAAEASLAAAKTQLAAAQQQADEAKKESAKLDDSVARLAKARTAIPDRKLIDDAAIVLVDIAQRSGVDTNFKAGSESQDLGASADGGGTLEGAVPIDLEFEAAGTYSEMMQFMAQVEDTVEERDDKLYTRGRLFNVVSLEIGVQEDEEGSSSGFSEEPQESDSGFVLGPNDIAFTIIVRMYTSSTDNAAAVGTETPDPAAAATGTDPATGSTATPDPNATGTGTTDGAATGASTETTTTDGAATATDGSAAVPTGGGI